MQGHVVDVQLSVRETDDLRSGRRIAQIVHGQLADVGDQQAAVLDKHALRSRQIAVGGNQHARDGIGKFQHIPFSFGIERVELARPETAHEQLSVRRKYRLSEPYPVGQHGRRRICLSFGAAGQRPSENREKKAFFHIVFFLKVNYLNYSMAFHILPSSSYYSPFVLFSPILLKYERSARLYKRQSEHFLCGSFLLRSDCYPFFIPTGSPNSPSISVLYPTTFSDGIINICSFRFP